MRSKEEILSELTGIPKYRLTADDKGEYITKSTALKAMEEYASEVLREELIKYDKWLCKHKWGTREILSAEKAINEYLKTK